MALEYIPARSDLGKKPLLENVIKRIRQAMTQQSGVVYYSWPTLKDYSDTLHRGDIALITEKGGLKLVIYTASDREDVVTRKYDEAAHLLGLVESQLSKSAKLRQKRRLKVDIDPILYAPNSPIDIGDEEATFVMHEDRLLEAISEKAETALSVADIEEVRSILEGAKALSRPKPRHVKGDGSEDVAEAFAELEEQIANFDAEQRGVAMTSLNCPQRIRGLAGTGKTVILAMKAALFHANSPTSKILITYYTRSLKYTIERLIVRFYRHFAEGEPDWNYVHVRHGWGRRDLPGVYRDTCNRESIHPKSYAEVKNQRDPFGFVCGELIANKEPSSYYDIVLIDEGQDFPDSFYQLCFFITKGARDEKNIIWAYDELQNVFDVKVRAPDVLFGNDSDGEPRISLTRSLPEGADTNDHVLQKSYRNQRDVLVMAHAIGFGVYGDTVQMLENQSHWEDVGYDVVSGTFEVGSEVVVKRPRRNSPARLNTPEDVPIIQPSVFEDVNEEARACAQGILEMMSRGLRAHDFLVIALDDRHAREYLSKVSKLLAEEGIQPNNLLAGGYDEPPFTMEDQVTLATVYRAKGNEAAVVFVLGADAATLRTRTGRNRLFVALTRTKGWLRLSGCNTSRYKKLLAEIEETKKHVPEIRFVMPDMTNLNTIQRDLEEKHARLTEAKTKLEKVKEDFNLTVEDFQSLIEDDDF